MCHGHPHHHPCNHQSVTWLYCPSALIDLETGYETPCSNVTFAQSQESKAECPLENCEYKAKGGSWFCCQCNQGPNKLGWCTYNREQPVFEKNYVSKEYSYVERCDHGCCKNCTRDPSIGDPPPENQESKKRSRSRKDKQKSKSGSHHKGSARSQPTEEEEGESSNAQHYDVQLDYSPKKGKSSHKKKINK